MHIDFLFCDCHDEHFISTSSYVYSIEILYIYPAHKLNDCVYIDFGLVVDIISFVYALKRDMFSDGMCDLAIA